MLGCDGIIAFHLLNYLHNGHILNLMELLEKIKDDCKFPAFLILLPEDPYDKLPRNVQATMELIDHSEFMRRRTVMSIWPTPSFKAGPADALFMANALSNCCITHYMVDLFSEGSCGNIEHPDQPD